MKTGIGSGCLFAQLMMDTQNNNSIPRSCAHTTSLMLDFATSLHMNTSSSDCLVTPAPQPQALGFKGLSCGGMFLHVSVLDLHLQLLNLCWLCICGGVRYNVVFWLDEHVSVLDLRLQLLSLCSNSVACVCVCWYRFKVRVLVG